MYAYCREVDMGEIRKNVNVSDDYRACAVKMARARLTGGEWVDARQQLLLWLTHTGWPQEQAEPFVDEVLREVSETPSPPAA